MLQQEIFDTTNNDTGGGGARRDEGNKTTQKAAKTGRVGGGWKQKNKDFRRITIEIRVKKTTNPK